MSDALCRPAVLSRELRPLAFAPSACCLATQALGQPPRQSQTPYYRVRATWTFWLRTPSTGAMLDLAAKRSQFAFTLTFTRTWLPTPFRSLRRDPSSSRWELPPRTTLLPFGTPCGVPERAGKMSLASLCNRSTTRAPTDRSIPGRAIFIELTVDRADTCSERPYDALLPCGNRTPGGHTLDGVFPASEKPTTTLPNGKS